MVEPPPSARLLLHCLEGRISPEIANRLHDQNEDGWEELVNRALWHGVAPLLHSRLGGLENVSPPRTQRDRLRDAYLHTHLKNTMILDQLREVVSELARNDLAVLVLKGAHLASRVYSEPGLRPMGDLDLLSRPGEADRVRDTLMAAGYRPSSAYEGHDFSSHHHQAPLQRDGCVDVEVHSDIVRPGAPFQIDLNGIWDRSERSDLDEQPFLHLAPDDLVLHLCTHAVYNDRLRLGLAASCDIHVATDALGQTLDWDRLIRTANEDGRSAVAYLGLAIARQLLGCPIPAEVLPGLIHDATADRILEDAVGYVVDPSRPVPVSVRAVDEASGMLQKAKALSRALFPSPSEMRRIYRLEPRSKLACLLYFVRPITLLARGGPQLLGLAGFSTTGRARIMKDRRRRRIDRWLSGAPDPGR